jgi:hypothetical protein
VFVAEVLATVYTGSGLVDMSVVIALRETVAGALSEDTFSPFSLLLVAFFCFLLSLFFFPLKAHFLLGETSDFLLAFGFPVVPFTPKAFPFVGNFLEDEWH